jgi:predicted small lipoprotein YifL
MEAISMETLKEKKGAIIILAVALIGCGVAVWMNLKPDSKPAPPVSMTSSTLPAEEKKAFAQQIQQQLSEVKKRPPAGAS